MIDVGAVCEHGEYDGRYVIEDFEPSRDRVTVVLWCRWCLQQVEWVNNNTTPGNPHEARLYCRPLPVAAQSGETR